MVDYELRLGTDTTHRGYIYCCDRKYSWYCSYTQTVKDGKVRTKEAKCVKCNDYCVEAKKEFGGFPTLIRTEPTLTKK